MYVDSAQKESGVRVALCEAACVGWWREQVRWVKKLKEFQDFNAEVLKKLNKIESELETIKKQNGLA